MSAAVAASTSRWTRFVIVAAAPLALLACGDDDDGDTDAAAAYCESLIRFDARGEEIFAGVDENDPAAIEAAEQEMVDFIEADGAFDPDNLPAEIRDDALAFLEGMKARAAGGTSTAEQDDAEERLLAWEEENCSADE